MTKERKPNPTWNLAMRFVKEILGEEFNRLAHGRHLADAKRLTNAEENDFPMDPEMIIGCLRCLQLGMFGFDAQVQSMWIVTYGNNDGNYYKQYLDYYNNAPDFYLVDEVKQWCEITGKQPPSEAEQGIILPPTYILTLEK